MAEWPIKSVREGEKRIAVRTAVRGRQRKVRGYWFQGGAGAGLLARLKEKMILMNQAGSLKEKINVLTFLIVCQEFQHGIESLDCEMISYSRWRPMTSNVKTACGLFLTAPR